MRDHQPALTKVSKPSESFTSPLFANPKHHPVYKNHILSRPGLQQTLGLIIAASWYAFRPVCIVYANKNQLRSPLATSVNTPYIMAGLPKRSRPPVNQRYQLNSNLPEALILEHHNLRPQSVYKQSAAHINLPRAKPAQ